LTDVFEHLHTNKVCHGDLSPHNTLAYDETNVIFGDFGAASMYHMLGEEQRALNYFIEDLLSVCQVESIIT